jgi:hypothetical protein
MPSPYAWTVSEPRVIQTRLGPVEVMYLPGDSQLCCSSQEAIALRPAIAGGAFTRQTGTGCRSHAQATARQTLDASMPPSLSRPWLSAARSWVSTRRRGRLVSLSAVCRPFAPRGLCRIWCPEWSCTAVPLRRGCIPTHAAKPVRPVGFRPGTAGPHMGDGGAFGQSPRPVTCSGSDQRRQKPRQPSVPSWHPIRNPLQRKLRPTCCRR